MSISRRDEATQDSPCYSTALPPLPESAGAARHAAERFLASASHADPLPTLGLLVSELVTNAVLHAGTRCTLRLSVPRHGVVRAEVSDAGHGTPAVADDNSADGCGNGLLLVASLAACWGVEPASPTGKTVWFELEW